MHIIYGSKNLSYEFNSFFSFKTDDSMIKSVVYVISSNF
jgi:hypothetical protein